MISCEEFENLNSQMPEKSEQTDTLVLLDKIEAREQAKEQEFFRLIGQIQKIDMEGTEKKSELLMLPELLKTKRERAVYSALMRLINADRKRLIKYQKHIYTLSQERHVLRQALHTIFDETIFDEVPKVRSSNERVVRNTLSVNLQQLRA
jgi:hypothetical protein